MCRSLFVRHSHGDVTGTFEDSGTAALGARHPALHVRTLVHEDGLDLQLVHVRAVVVLGVGDGGLQYLAHQLGAVLGTELHDFQRLTHALAADLVGDQAALLRGDARVTMFGGYLHVATLMPWSRSQRSCERRGL